MPTAAPPLHIVLNSRSGHSAPQDVQAAIEQVLGDAGRRFEIRSPESPEALGDLAAATVAAARASGGVVVACGGDGTINTVAQAVLGSGIAFGVIPLGTFNYFARAHGLPADPAEAAQVLLSGQTRPVQVGLLDERIFLVNASVGLYPQLLEDREAYKSQFGRSRIVALGAAVASFVRAQRQMRLTLAPAGEAPRAVRTPLVFVGNNRLQLEQIGIDEAAAIDAGRLVVITLRPVGTLAMLVLLVRGAFGGLGAADEVFSIATTEISVASARPNRKPRPIKVATDGEVAWMTPPLRFRVSPEPLLLIVANESPVADDAA